MSLLLFRLFVPDALRDLKSKVCATHSPMKTKGQREVAVLRDKVSLVELVILENLAILTRA